MAQLLAAPKGENLDYIKELQDKFQDSHDMMPPSQKWGGYKSLELVFENLDPILGDLQTSDVGMMKFPTEGDEENKNYVCLLTGYWNLSEPIKV